MLTEEDQAHISSDEEDEDYTTVGSVDSIASTISRASKATKTASKCDNCNKDRSKAKFYDRVVEITSTSGDAALLCLPCRIEWIKHNEESGAIIQFEESSTMTKSRINKEFPKLKNKQLQSSSTKRGYKGTTVNLYSATDVFQAAREVYGGWVGLQERQLEKKQRKVDRERQRESRKTAIFSLLDKNGAGALRFNELDTDIQKYIEQSRVPKRSKASRSILQEEFMEEVAFKAKIYTGIAQQGVKNITMQHISNKMIDNEDRDVQSFVEMIISGPRDKEARSQELTKALEAKGLVLREDSAFCRDYISKGKGTVTSVVTMMQEMDWYFTYTNYDRLRIVHQGSGAHQIDWRMGKKKSKEQWLVERLQSNRSLPLGAYNGDPPEHMHEDIDKQTKEVWKAHILHTLTNALREDERFRESMQQLPMEERDRPDDVSNQREEISRILGKMENTYAERFGQFDILHEFHRVAVKTLKSLIYEAYKPKFHDIRNQYTSTLPDQPLSRRAKRKHKRAFLAENMATMESTIHAHSSYIKETFHGMGL